MGNENRNPGQQGGQAPHDQQQSQQDKDKARRDQQQKDANKPGQDQQRNRDPQPGDPEDNRSNDQRQGQAPRKDQQR